MGNQLCSDCGGSNSSSSSISYNNNPNTSLIPKCNNNNNNNNNRNRGLNNDNSRRVGEGEGGRKGKKSINPMIMEGIIREAKVRRGKERGWSDEEGGRMGAG